MRRVVLDTETTGLELSEGHRIIEVACIEMDDRRPTGRHFHRYLNPERAVDLAASEVHGLTAEDLSDKPRFADIADDFLAFVEGAELLIHNASFDVGFLDAELERAGKPRVSSLCRVMDTLEFARELNPGKRNSLNALCDRYGVDHSHRTLHGALLDAQLLADVWVAMTRGQETLDIVLAAADAVALAAQELVAPADLAVLTPDEAELARHAALCERLHKASGGRCLWVQLAAAG
jgi:DNA polymerase-3 subunit epsilon